MQPFFPSKSDAKPLIYPTTSFFITYSGSNWHNTDPWTLYSLTLFYKGAGSSFDIRTHRQIIDYYIFLFNCGVIDGQAEHLDGRKYVFHIIDAGFRAAKGMAKTYDRITWPLYELAAKIIAETEGIEFRPQDISCVLRAFNHVVSLSPFYKVFDKVKIFFLE